MNAVQLHLVLTHFPIVGFIAAGGLLFYALWRGSREARLIALVGIALAGLIVLPVLATGDASEEQVEHMPGVSETLLHRHEDAAEVAGTLATVTGILALLVLGLERWAPGKARMGALLLVVLVVASTASVGWAGHLGGRIRHPELRAGAAEGGGGDGQRSEKHEDDDDDDDEKGGARKRD